MKYLLTLIVLMFSGVCYAQSFTITVSNPMMVTTSPSAGEVAVYGIDAYNPTAHCAAFIPPNTCNVNGNEIEWGIVFNYEVQMTGTGSLDVNFVENNGVGGFMGAFNITQSPSPLLGLTNGSTGSFNYNVSFPIFSTQLSYGLIIEVDVTYNP